MKTDRFTKRRGEHRALMEELMVKVHSRKPNTWGPAREAAKRKWAAEKAKANHWRHIAARRALVREFAKVQEGKKDLSVLRHRLERFKKIDSSDRILVAAFREGLAWRAKAKRNGETYPVVESYTAMMRNRRREEREAA